MSPFYIFHLWKRRQSKWVEKPISPRGVIKSVASLLNLNFILNSLYVRINILINATRDKNVIFAITYSIVFYARWTFYLFILLLNQQTPLETTTAGRSYGITVVSGYSWPTSVKGLQSAAGEIRKYCLLQTVMTQFNIS